jgi:glycosyl transferase family 25
MRAYVINLPPTIDERLSRARREHMISQLARAQLEYRLIAAVDGFRLTPDQLATIDEDAVALHDSWLTRGVLGASLSHVQAYREILTSGEPSGLVLEDDVTLDRHVGELLDGVERHLESNEVVLLYWRTRGSCEFSAVDRCQLGGGYELLYPMSPGALSCASAYVVTQDACRTLLEAVIPVHTGTDVWGDFYERGAFTQLRCVVPRAVGVDPHFKSTVDYLPRHSVAATVSSAIAHHHIFPAYQLLGWKRALQERRMTNFVIVNERSPVSNRR